jgi:hypothetical protein
VLKSLKNLNKTKIKLLQAIKIIIHPCIILVRLCVKAQRYKFLHSFLSCAKLTLPVLSNSYLFVPVVSQFRNSMLFSCHFLSSILLLLFCYCPFLIYDLAMIVVFFQILSQCNKTAMRLQNAETNSSFDVGVRQCVPTYEIRASRLIF